MRACLKMGEVSWDPKRRRSWYSPPSKKNHFNFSFLLVRSFPCGICCLYKIFFWYIAYGFSTPTRCDSLWHLCSCFLPLLSFILSLFFNLCLFSSRTVFSFYMSLCTLDILSFLYIFLFPQPYTFYTFSPFPIHPLSLVLTLSLCISLSSFQSSLFSCFSPSFSVFPMCLHFNQRIFFGSALYVISVYYLNQFCI